MSRHYHDSDCAAGALENIEETLDHIAGALDILLGHLAARVLEDDPNVDHEPTTEETA